MPDIYVFADETGDLDFGQGSDYFGIGTATYDATVGSAIAEGFLLRLALEANGVRMRQGFHAKNDSHRTRGEVFDLIRRQAPRFDATFLYKPKASPHVRDAGSARLYQQAFYLHFKGILQRVSLPGDRVFVIAGHLQTSKKRGAIHAAVTDVCAQVGNARTVVPCVWDAQSAWGVQVADYGLWSTQRALLATPPPWHATCVAPTLRSEFFPWGQA